MGNIDFFNDLAVKSNDLMNTGRSISLRLNLYRNIFNDINGKVKFSAADRVLDLGGGCGQITEYIARNCQRVVLADGAPNAIELAKRQLAQFGNVSYFVCDINQPPLPDFGMKFDKIICYSVIQYLDSFEKLGALLTDLLARINPEGKIFFGDIPLPDKLARYLVERRNYPIKNFILNQKYYARRFLTGWLFRKNNINVDQVQALPWSKEKLKEILNRFSSLEYTFLTQNKKLIFSNSSEDLLIIKK